MDAARPFECTLELNEPAPLGPTPRDLRAIPDIGDARALALARAFWERGGVGFDLSEIPGIGPVSAARVREWFATRGESRTE